MLFIMNEYDLCNPKRNLEIIKFQGSHWMWPFQCKFSKSDKGSGGSAFRDQNPGSQSKLLISGLNRNAEPKQISKKGTARSLIEKWPLQPDTQTSCGYLPDLPIKLPTSDLPWLLADQHIAIQSHQNVSS